MRPKEKKRWGGGVASSNKHIRPCDVKEKTRQWGSALGQNESFSRGRRAKGIVITGEGGEGGGTVGTLDRSKGDTKEKPESQPRCRSATKSPSQRHWEMTPSEKKVPPKRGPCRVQRLEAWAASEDTLEKNSATRSQDCGEKGDVVP